MASLLFTCTCVVGVILVRTLGSSLESCEVSVLGAAHSDLPPGLTDPVQRSIYQALFGDWLTEHSVTVASTEEYVHRLKIFVDNDVFIRAVNEQRLPYRLGHNAFSHLAFEEWRRVVRMGLKTGRNSSRAFRGSPAHDGTLPTTVDWVAEGAVTSVKNQGECGSCWSFSAVGALESAYYLRYGVLRDLSEQNLVDCDDKDSGCGGGEMANAFEWIIGHGGICTEEAYPYVSGETKTGETCSTCDADPSSAPNAYSEVTRGCDACLQAALAKQPVAVAIEADHREFQLYKSGVFTGSCGFNLDHGVLAVGYGESEDGHLFYKVKNSWGSAWGMDGYILLERGAKSDHEVDRGKCGILLGPPVYPTF